MKKFTFFVFAFIFFATLLDSCKKEQKNIQTSTDGARNNELIATAKNFFTNNIEGKSSEKPLPLPPLQGGVRTFLNPVKALIKKADWGKAYVQAISSGNIVVVPIHFQNQMSRRPFGLHSIVNIPIDDLYKLIVYNDGKDRFHAEVITSIADTSWLQNPLNSFTGVAVVQDWKGNFLKGYLYSRNTAPQPLYFADSSQGNRDIKGNPSELSAIYVCTTEQYYTCAGSVSDPYQYCTYSYTVNLGCTYIGGTTGGDGSTVNAVDYGVLSSGGGVGTPTATVVGPNSIFYAPKYPVNIATELHCFTKISTSNYFISLNVEEPSPGSGASWDGGVEKAGHTYLTFEQDNADGSKVIRNVGFYPIADANPLNYSGPSTFGENSSSKVSAQLKMSVSSTNFSNAISTTLSQTSNYNYNLYSYNCSTAALNILASANINGLFQSSGFFSGDFPGLLGVTIRNLNVKTFGLANGGIWAVKYTSTTNSLLPPAKTGTCQPVNDP